MPCTAASGDLQAARPKAAILRLQPEPGTGLFECRAPTRQLRDRVPERHDLELRQAPQGGYWIGRGYDTSKDQITTASSRISNYRAANGSPPEVGDLPGYSMFQERAPWALVTGEEHFTSSGYHSERRHQGPSASFFVRGSSGALSESGGRVTAFSCPLANRQGIANSATSFATLRTEPTTRCDPPPRRASDKSLIHSHPS